jgi:hypothetical protein
VKAVKDYSMGVSYSLAPSLFRNGRTTEPNIKKKTQLNKTLLN